MALTLLICLGCLLAACDALGQGVPVAPEPFERAGRLESRACWFDTGTIQDFLEIRCATFHVPERWGDASSPALRLPVVVVGFGVVKDAGAPPMSDAILIPGGGGPGRSMGLESDQAGDTLDFTQFLINGSGRDLVLVDQRGAGLSDPALHCEEFEEAMLRYLAVDMPPEAEALLWGNASRRCARRLEAQGWTPAAFDTRSAARDLEALRGALGYSQWNLYGTSYAANLSLAYARDFPGSVRSLILESPDVPDGDFADAPENFERVLGTLFERCERDERCRRDYPDPAGALDRVLARLDAHPLAIDVSHPRTLEAVSVLVTPVRLLDSISSALYSTHSAHELPRIVTAADRGSFDMLSQLVKEHVWSQLDSRFAIGLLEVISCRESIPYSDLDRLERESTRHSWRRGYVASARVARAQCTVWNVGEADPAERRAAVFPGPTLILAGQLDPVIPISDARRAADNLPRSRLIEFPATGHDSEYAWWRCVDELMTKFVLDPERRSRPQPEDAACRKTAEGMRFQPLGLRETLPAP